MKKVIKIETHSFVDVITNSSTELFVCNTDKSVEMVKEILTEKYESFNKLYDRGKQDVNDILEVKIADEKCVKDMEEWKEYYSNLKIKKGDIIIKGIDDNSIPYEFFDVIEELFDVLRYHLG